MYEIPFTRESSPGSPRSTSRGVRGLNHGLWGMEMTAMNVFSQDGQNIPGISLLQRFPSAAADAARYAGTRNNSTKCDGNRKKRPMPWCNCQFDVAKSRVDCPVLCCVLVGDVTF